MKKNILEVNNLTKKYNSKKVLNEISFKVESGEIKNPISFSIYDLCNRMEITTSGGKIIAK